MHAQVHYALIGLGVTPDPEQPVTLREQYGLQLGGVSMPHGKNHPAHMQRSNDGIALIVMIATPEGVAQATENAAVPGVDGVFVGKGWRRQRWMT